MLIGEQQSSWLTSASSDKDRDKRIDQTIRIAVAVLLQGCASGQGCASDKAPLPMHLAAQSGTESAVARPRGSGRS